MSVRPDLEWLDLAISPDELRSALEVQRRPWCLVCDGGVEAIHGVTHVSDPLALYAGGKPLELRSDLSEPLYVPQTMPVFRLPEAFRTSREHIAVALDAYGGVAGIVTLDDIVDGLVGDVTGRGGHDEPWQLARNEDGWVAAGTVGIDDVLDELELLPVALTGRRGYRTLGGSVLAQLGRVPATGDAFVWQAHRFEVVAMDDRRIERVRISPAG